MKLQQKRNSRGIAALVLGLGVALIAPAVAAEIYSWRTEDGGYAYTDDRDQVPARYANQVKVLRDRKLEAYDRYTPQDGAAGHDYAEKLSARLERLRAVNASAAQPALRQAPGALPQNTLALSTGDDRAPLIQVPTGNGLGPIVVEPVNAKATGDIRTRRVTVIRQGDETLAVIKSNPHVINVNDDIYDEDELVDGAPLN